MWKICSAVKETGTSVCIPIFRIGLQIRTWHVRKIWGFHSGEDSYFGVICSTSSVGGLKCFGWKYHILLQNGSWKQYVPSICWYQQGLLPTVCTKAIFTIIYLRIFFFICHQNIAGVPHQSLTYYLHMYFWKLKIVKGGWSFRWVL